jgi:hypothetical protein
METTTAVARRMWTLFEPVHAVTYFAPEARAAFEDAGLRGFWRGYFAGRAAPLGAVTAAPVTASFYNFAPLMVSRALPSVWQLISPRRALDVRCAGAVAALRRVLGDLADAVPVAADLLAVAAADLDCAGRVLAAANGAIPRPDEPVARLWQAATTLREYRGDGHFAALLAADIDGCEALVLRAGLDVPREQLQPLRGWSDQEWDDATRRLADRGWIGPDSLATPAGTAARLEIEQRTDAAAARPWSRLGPAFAAELAAALAPIALACAAELPYPNPVGAPNPAQTATDANAAEGAAAAGNAGPV